MTVGRSGEDDPSSATGAEASSLFISSSLRCSSLSEPSLTATVASSSSKESSLSSSLPSDQFHHVVLSDCVKSPSVRGPVQGRGLVNWSLFQKNRCSLQNAAIIAKIDLSTSFQKAFFIFFSTFHGGKPFQDFVSRQIAQLLKDLEEMAPFRCPQRLSFNVNASPIQTLAASLRTVRKRPKLVDVLSNKSPSSAETVPEISGPSIRELRTSKKMAVLVHHEFVTFRK